MKKTGKRQEEPNSTWMGLMCAVMKGSLAAFVLALGLLFACSAAVSAGWFRQAVVDRAPMVVCVLSAFLGGCVSIRRRREFSLPVGLGTGIGLFCLLLAIGVLLYEQAPIPESVPNILCACLCGGALAGIMGRKSKKKRRR